MSVQTSNDQISLQVPLWTACALTSSQPIYEILTLFIYVGGKKVQIYIPQCIVDSVHKEALFYLTSGQDDGRMPENYSMVLSTASQHLQQVNKA